MSESMEFVIRARDEATKILNQFNESTKQLGDSMDSVNKKSSSLQLSLGGVTGALAALAGAYAAVKAGESMFTYLNESADKFLKLEMEKRLNDTLKGSARQIELATNIDEGQIRQVMRSAQESFDPSQIDEVTRATVGLSYALEIPLSEAFQKVRAATEGSFGALEYLIPGMRDLTSESDKLAAVSAFASQGIEGQTQKANSALDVFARLSVEAENLATTVGQMVAPFKQLALEGLVVVVEVINQALIPAIDDFRTYFAEMSVDVENNSKQMAEGIVGSFTFVETTLHRLTDVLDLVSSSFLLSFIRIESMVQHTFAEVIPAYTIWFARQFVNILQDMVISAAYVWSNFNQNIANSFRLTLEYIMGGWKEQGFDEFMWEMGMTMGENLFRGFESATEALPEVGERAVSELEKATEAMMNDYAWGITSEFDEKFQRRMDAVTDRMRYRTNPIETKVNLMLKQTEDLNLQDQQIKALGAFESRIMVRGDTVESPERKIADYAKHIADQMDKLVKLAENPLPPRSAEDRAVAIVPVGSWTYP